MARVGALVHYQPGEKRRVAPMAGGESVAPRRISKRHKDCLVFRSERRSHGRALPRLQLVVGADVASIATAADCGWLMGRADGASGERSLDFPVAAGRRARRVAQYQRRIRPARHAVGGISGAYGRRLQAICQRSKPEQEGTRYADETAETAP